MNVRIHDRKIYDKGKSSKRSHLEEFYSLNQSTTSAYLPPTNHLLDLDKNITDNRRNKAVEKVNMEARSEIWHVAKPL